MVVPTQLLQTTSIDTPGSNLPPTELVAKFSAVIEGLQAKIGAPGMAGSIDSQVVSLIDANDKVGNDDKLDQNELAAALGITPGQALDFIIDFNTPGDTDGALDAKELTSAYGVVQEATEEAEPPSAGPEQTGGESGGGGGTEGASKGGGGGSSGALSGFLDILVKLLDKDGDGKISEKEAQDFIDKHAGADGKLSMEELKEGLKAEAKEKGVELPELPDEVLTKVFGEAVKGDETIDAAEFATAMKASAETET